MFRNYLPTLEDRVFAGNAVIKVWLAIVLLGLSPAAQAQLLMPPENDQIIISDPIQQQIYLNSCEKAADAASGLAVPAVDIHAVCQCALEHQKFIPKHEFTSIAAIKQWKKLMKVTADSSALIVILTPVIQEVIKLCKAEHANVP